MFENDYTKHLVRCKQCLQVTWLYYEAQNIFLIFNEGEIYLKLELNTNIWINCFPNYLQTKYFKFHTRFCKPMSTNANLDTEIWIISMEEIHEPDVNLFFQMYFICLRKNKTFLHSFYLRPLKNALRSQ